MDLTPLLKNRPVLRLSPWMTEPMQFWIRQFDSAEPAWMENPKISDGMLHVSPLALPFLFLYAREQDCSELEWRRLCSEARNFLMGLLKHACDTRERQAIECSLENFARFAFNRVSRP